MGRTTFQQEYPLRKVSVNSLWRMIATSAGLCEWFCDNLTIEGDLYTFMWKNNTRQAWLLEKEVGEFIRFRWNEDIGSELYFEMRIIILELTGTVALIITDTEEEDEEETIEVLWNHEIAELKHLIGLV